MGAAHLTAGVPARAAGTTPLAVVPWELQTGPSNQDPSGRLETHLRTPTKADLGVGGMNNRCVINVGT